MSDIYMCKIMMKYRVRKWKQRFQALTEYVLLLDDSGIALRRYNA